MAERGCYVCAIFCYSGHLDFLVRLKGGAILLRSAIFCYFGVVCHTKNRFIFGLFSIFFEYLYFVESADCNEMILNIFQKMS